MYKKIYLFIFLITISYATINPLLGGKGSEIIDIGSKKHSNYIEVPFSKIFYSPNITFVNNIIIYNQRVQTIKDCDIDKFGHMGCPIETSECIGSYEYSNGLQNGSGVGNISCSTLNPLSYLDKTRDKCILPQNVSNVCSNYSGSYYNNSLDRCVTGGEYKPNAVIVRTSNSWWWCDSCAWNAYIPSTALPIVQAAGGTYAKIITTTSGGARPTVTYTLSTNAVEPYYITFESFDSNYPKMKVNPGDKITLGGQLIRNTTTNVTLSGPDKPTVIFYKDTITYPCQAGYAPIMKNGEHWCSNIAYHNPVCNNNIFNQRDKDECMSEIKKYTYYNYKCEDGVNIYGNSWEIINKGGDCGGGNDGIDTDGDGIKNICNSLTPPQDNCFRSMYRCPLDSSKQCVQTEKNINYNNFSNWKVYDLFGQSKWEILNQNSVIQKNNANYSMLLSDYEAKNNEKITISGVISSAENIDNDWFGFVFGYKNSNDFYLIDWSKNPNDNYLTKDQYGNYKNQDTYQNPINGAIPLTLLKSSTSNESELRNHENTPLINIFKRQNNAGWTTNQKYNVKIEIDNRRVQVWLGKVGESMNLEIDYYSLKPIDFDGKIGFYNNSLANTTFEDFDIKIESQSTLDIKNKHPLLNYGIFSGNFKPDDFDNMKSTECTNSNETCMQSLHSIITNDNTLVFRDKQGVEGSFTFNGNCLFSGKIESTGIDNQLLKAAFISPDEVVLNHNLKTDYDSPTSVSLDFQNINDIHYDMGKIKSSANIGDQVTVDFWLYSNDNNYTSKLIGFYDDGKEPYSLYKTSNPNNLFGFNTQTGDLLGSSNTIPAKKWTKITAIFTHKDVAKNKLYIDGKEISISNLNNIMSNNDNADITSNLTINIPVDVNSTVNMKIAGLRVYDGGLDNQEILRGFNGGGNRGINRIEVYKNSIIGYDNYNTPVGTIISSCMLNGKVGYIEDGSTTQITGAKVVNGRIVFSDSFLGRGEIGFIEVLKVVSPSDFNNGFVHEFREFSDLYEKGFTGFISSNSKTYAVSKKEMSINDCLLAIRDTGYYLAERRNDDLESLNIIKALSYYTSGDYKEHCVIEKSGKEDNLAAQWAIKNIIKNSIATTFSCSPYGCKDFKCGYASCPGDSNGSMLIEKDIKTLDTNTCIDQKCDISKPYFPYCGNKNGCDTKDKTITQTQDGKCVKATCNGTDLFNSGAGKCEKMGCEYETRGTKCYKKLY